MITTHSAKTLHLQDGYGTSVGNAANLVILPLRMDSMRYVIDACRYSIRHGRVITRIVAEPGDATDPAGSRDV